MKISLVQNIMLISSISGFALMEYITRRQRPIINPTKDDNYIEILMLVSLVVIIQPFVIMITQKIGHAFFSDYQGIIASWSWWWMALALLLVDDLTQYAWHRLSHTSYLWPLHRAHHSANYMGVRITFRNNFFYYLLMPGLWLAAFLLYLGLDAVVYSSYLIIKLIVVVGAHARWRWDERLYKIPSIRPLAWLIERAISTPATHAAHHALVNDDGIGHYTGNFGNLLFFWDILFGTALITRQYPQRVGLLDDQKFGNERWYHQIFFPLMQSKREETALSLISRNYPHPAAQFEKSLDQHCTQSHAQ